MDAEGTLLLIDDDTTTRELLTLLLESEGWQVSSAVDGIAALGMLQSAAAVPDVVLCDLRMPGLSGSPLAHALRQVASAKAGRTVLLAMTATTAEAAPPDGFDRLLVKPFPPSAVRAALEASTLAPQSAPAEAAVLLQDTVQRVRATMSLAQFTSLYSFALNDAEDRIAQMQKAANAADDAAFRKEAHALKGSAGMIGAARLSGMAAVAERDGFAGAASTQQFHAAIAQIRLMLETMAPGGSD